MLKQDQITIGDNVITIQQFPTTKAITYAIHIAQIVGGISEGIGETFTGDMFDVPINPGKLVDGIIKRLDWEKSPRLLYNMVKDSMVQPEFSDTWYEDAFAGNFGALVDLVTAIVNLNRYPEFLKKRVAVPMSHLFSTSQEQASTP